MAVTVDKAIQLGGGITKIIGSLTHTEGAAEETLTAAGGTVVGFQVLNNTTSGVIDVTGSVPCTWSGTSGTLTITFQNVAAISSGRFWIDVLHG